MQDIPTLDRNSFFTRQFSDLANYPYGFSRSGDFSISESNALSEYGLLITALIDGTYTATSQEDKDLLDVALGKKAADNNNVVERAWDKYQKRIHRRKHINIYGSNKVSDEEETESSAIIEEDIGTDTEL
jgi:uncharacterized protein YifE (UPF0438 family)